MTVAHTLWKAKSVVASKAGKIPLQVSGGEGGFLVDLLEKTGFHRRHYFFFEFQRLPMI